MQHDSITRIVAEIQSGSPHAAEQLYIEYQSLVIRVIRRSLSRDLRRIADTVDFAQAVWKTLFEHASHLQQMDNREVIAAYIARVASNKVLTEARAQLAQKRDMRRTGNGPVAEPALLPARDPTPSQTAMAQETFEALTSGLDGLQQQMIAQRVAGYTLDEIATNLGVNERTVRRVLNRLSQR